MSENHGAYKHDASDKKLDKAATDAAAAESAAASHPHPTHDHADTRKHDDTGKDRLFEGRIQHDDADKESDRNRQEKDIRMTLMRKQEEMFVIHVYIPQPVIH